MDEARWSRSTYPLNLPFKVSAVATSPTEEGDKSSLDRFPREPHDTNDAARWYRSVTHHQRDRYPTTSQPGNDSNLSSHQATESFQACEGSSTAVSMSHGSPSPPLATCDFQSPPGEAAGSSSPAQHLRDNQNEDDQGSSPWTRSECPLGAPMETATEHQSPVSISASTAEEESEQIPDHVPTSDHTGATHRKLRRTPRSRRIFSSVSSAGEEDAASSSQLTENEVDIAASGASPWRKIVYPLQATASSATTQHAAPLASDEVASKTSLDHPGDKEESSTGSTLQDRPVESQQPFTSNSNSESEAANLPKTPTYHSQNSDRAARRQAYPLQSMASVATLRNTLTPPPSPKQSPKISAVQVRENDKAAPRSKTYPLQSPASIASFQNLPPPSEEFQEKAAPSADQSRETELATKVIKQWKRQLYPLQNGLPEKVPLLRRLPEEEFNKTHNPRSIHLPKHIRAVTDAEKHESQGRTICVLLDGTGDKFDNDNSNIVHLVSALKKDDPRQVTYYQAGIGTYGAGGLSGGVSAAMDMAVGSSLGLHVRDAYHFLMHTYKEGDKICIFSFSRGAYTARCLAGMIHKVGLLPPRNTQQISFAYEFYKNDTPEGWKQSSDFKKTFCINVCVYFLGCFDSVASVGIIPRQLPLSSTPTNKCRYFRHAMALDERRAKFKICRHQTKTWDQIKKGTSPIAATAKAAQAEAHHYLPNYKDQDDAPPRYSPQTKSEQTNHPNLTNEEYDDITAHEAPFETDVLEVWFAGAHADIGGGAVPNEERHKLAQIPLRWMIRQAFECNTGIIFRTAVLAEHGLDVHTLWPKYQNLTAPTHEPPPSFLEKYEKGLPPRSIRRSKLIPIDKHENGEHFYHLKNHPDEDWTPEQVEDFFDAMSPLNDQLVQVPNWWILEVLPVQYKVPTAPGQVQLRTGMNLGRYRGVEDIEPNVHWTALHRVKHIGYTINVRTAPHVAWRVTV